MNRLEAINLVIDSLTGDEVLIHANGAISRESFSCADREGNFYMLGSMGLAASIGLGFAMCRPACRVIVLDGDGNVLMGLGNLALIGAMMPSNLVHAVLDNGTYGTTGDQPTISPHIHLSEMARGAGYLHCTTAVTPAKLTEALSRTASCPGPHFIHIRVDHEVPRTCPRIPYDARRIKERFMRSFNSPTDR